jgi:hypothetical protein
MWLALYPPKQADEKKPYDNATSRNLSKSGLENRWYGWVDLLRRADLSSAVPLVDDVVETSEMARQKGKKLSYPRDRQGQVCVGVYGRCCGSIVANKLASLGRSSTRFHLDKAWDR